GTAVLQPQQVSQNHMRFGSDVAGSLRAAGALDELEIFNYPMSADQIDWHEPPAGPGGDGTGCFLSPSGPPEAVEEPVLFFSFAPPEPGVINEDLRVKGTTAMVRAGQVRRPFLDCSGNISYRYFAWTINSTTVTW